MGIGLKSTRDTHICKQQTPYLTCDASGVSWPMLLIHPYRAPRCDLALALFYE